MRLLNTFTLKLVDFFGRRTPEYAILSHTWEEEEVLFKDMADLERASFKAGFPKVEGACALARRQGYKYIWIDTCCIDKSSSAELTEAINSMYQWYAASEVCYAYLCDIKYNEDLVPSRWFTRGWTLQELIAPRNLQFYSQDWTYLGNKHDEPLLWDICIATGIEDCVLLGKVQPQDVSVARRMYWASNRVTTRKEDEAYCLMGLFGVNMPLIYGEREAAFRRLQEGIINLSDDQSILAWYSMPENANPQGFDVLADSPKRFENSKSASLFPFHRPGRKSIIATSYGIEIELVIFDIEATSSQEPEFHEVAAILDCQWGRTPGSFPLLNLRKNLSGKYARMRTSRGFGDEIVLQDSEFLIPGDDSTLGLDPQWLPDSTDRLGWVPRAWKFEKLHIMTGHGITRSIQVMEADAPFWLVPLESSEGKIRVLDFISDTTVATWDEATLQCRSERTSWLNNDCIAGLAIVLVTSKTEQASPARFKEEVMVVFGFRGGGPHWCHLSKVSANVTTEQAFSRLHIREFSKADTVSTIRFSGVKLVAEIKLREVSGKRFNLVTLQVASELELGV